MGEGWSVLSPKMVPVTGWTFALAFIASLSVCSALKPMVQNDQGVKQTLATEQVEDAVELVASPTPKEATPSPTPVPYKCEKPECEKMKPPSISWGYTTNGPAKWSGLDPSFAACKGSKQSPVEITTFDIGTDATKGLPSLTLNFTTSATTLVNDGHGITLVYDPGSSISLAETHSDITKYDVKNITFKTPAEHLVRGVQLHMEAQILCQNKDGTIVMIAVPMQAHTNAQMTNTFLASLWPHLPLLQNTKVSRKEKVDLRQLTAKDITFYPSRGGLRVSYPHYTYQGSLTTPPCTEDVKWIVWYKPVGVFQKQVKTLKKIMADMGETSGNSRPVQPLGSRKITYRTLF